MMARHRQAQAARTRLDDFGPLPTVRQQIATLVLAGALMLVISGGMAHLGLI